MRHDPERIAEARAWLTKAGGDLRPSAERTCRRRDAIALFHTGSRRMGAFDRMTFEPHVRGGRACIRGMRIPVSVIVRQLARGASREEILSDYPDLEPEDIQQSFE